MRCLEKLKITYRLEIAFNFPDSSIGKGSACSAEDPGLIPGSGRSPGEGNGDHSSILAWRTPWAEEPGGLRSVVMTNSWTQLSDKRENLKFISYLSLIIFVW